MSYRFKVHRAVIEAACTNFVNVHSDNNSITVPSSTGNIVKKTIKFIYFGKIELITSTALDVLDVAHVLGIKALQEQCTQYLSDHLTPNSSLDVVKIATEYDEFELFRIGWKFMCEKFELIEFDNLDLDEQTAKDVVSKSMLNCFTTMESAHKNRIPDLLESINLGNVSSMVSLCTIQNRTKFTQIEKKISDAKRFPGPILRHA